MTDHQHERAIELILRRDTEDVAASDLAWLDSHLGLCGECATFAEGCEETEQMLRTLAVTATPALVEATAARVRMRAAELQEQRSRTVLIAVSFCIGTLTSGASAWLWWKLGGWVAMHFGWSRAIVEPGVFVALMLPALIIAVFVLMSSGPGIDRTWTIEMLGLQKEGGRQ